jgi:hypothetical protein
MGNFFLIVPLLHSVSGIFATFVHKIFISPNIISKYPLWWSHVCICKAWYVVRNSIKACRASLTTSRREVLYIIIIIFRSASEGPDSSVGIVTVYGLDGPGIESRWGARFSAPVQTGPEAPPSLPYSGYRIFPGAKVRPGRDVDPSPPSSAEVKNIVELYLYSP